MMTDICIKDTVKKVETVNSYSHKDWEELLVYKRLKSAASDNIEINHEDVIQTIFSKNHI